MLEGSGACKISAGVIIKIYFFKKSPFVWESVNYRLVFGLFCWFLCLLWMMCGWSCYDKGGYEFVSWSNELKGD